MKVDGRPYRSIWLDEDGRTVVVIDQTRLPHSFATRRLLTVEDAADAIRTMVVRGAPLIGATAAYGLALALARRPRAMGTWRAPSCSSPATRPTAVNLRWALEDLGRRLRPLACRGPRRRRLPPRRRDLRRGRRHQPGHRRERARPDRTRQRKGKDGPINVLTHCNAGWLATVDWGTALAPLYMAHDKGIPVHVWVDETRPRNQGARAHGVGTRAPRRAAHGDRGQCRRPPDAARHGRPLHHRHRPHDDCPRRRVQQDRHLSEGARRRRQRRAPSTSPSPIRPSTGRWRTAPTPPSSSGTRTRC